MQPRQKKQQQQQQENDTIVTEEQEHATLEDWVRNSFLPNPAITFLIAFNYDQKTSEDLL